LYTPAAFHAERSAWRTVVYLNLIRSVLRVLDAISPALEDDIDIDRATLNSVSIDPHPETPSLTAPRGPSITSSTTVVDKYEEYKLGLEPLYALEEKLHGILCGVEDEQEITQLGPVGLPVSSTSTNGGDGSEPKPSLSSLDTNVNAKPKRAKKEIALHTSTNWKKAFSLSSSKSKLRSASGNHGDSSKSSSPSEGWWEDPEDVGHLLHRCSGSMERMWGDPSVQKRLGECGLRLKESPGFYLDEIPRIASLRYLPTDDDVLKARLKTMGVIEHAFAVSAPSSLARAVDWKIYDVGGARNQRQAWAPYFQDVNAIIFLAPISAFDQVLVEDARVNRLEDSLLLWKSVVQNKLLQNVNIILFLNKCDLLQAKLDAGIRLNQYMVSYGDRPNDYESVSRYFRNKFGALHQSFTPNKDRELYIHLTAVTDTKRTATIITDVRDFIVKGNLKSMALV
jgi:guanine nucleotide-binding protein subunit alpha